MTASQNYFGRILQSKCCEMKRDERKHDERKRDERKRDAKKRVEKRRNETANPISPLGHVIYFRQFCGQSTKIQQHNNNNPNNSKAFLGTATQCLLAVKKPKYQEVY